MTQKEFVELTNLPEEQYVTANANYEESGFEKQEWAKYYLQVVNNPLYDMAVTTSKEKDDVIKMLNDDFTKLEDKILELAEFIADQAEEKHSRTLAIKARELMGEKDYLIYKLRHSYTMTENDNMKVAHMLEYGDLEDEIEHHEFEPCDVDSENENNEQ